MAQRDLGNGVKVEVWKVRHSSELLPIVGLLCISFPQSITARFIFGHGIYVERSYDILHDVNLDKLTAVIDGDEIAICANGTPLDGVSIHRSR